MHRKKSKSKEMLEYYTKERLQQITNKRIQSTLAHKLAKTGKWHTDDKEILLLKDKHDETVAHYLAMYNHDWQPAALPEWLLNFKGREINDPLALILAKNKKLITYERKILEIRNCCYTRVAHVLAKVNKEWITFDKNILMLLANSGNTVADELAKYNPRWCYYNINLKYFDSMREKLIAKKKYIASQYKKNVLTFIPII